MNAPAGNRTDYLGAWKGDFGDLEEEIKKIVESDVEDVDAARREDLTHWITGLSTAPKPLK